MKYKYATRLIDRWLYNSYKYTYAGVVTVAFIYKGLKCAIISVSRSEINYER